MFYIKLLYTFILSLVLNKNEYDVRNKSFNPLKIIMVSLLSLSFVFNIVLIVRVSDFYSKIERVCPHALKEIVKK